MKKVLFFVLLITLFMITAYSVNAEVISSEGRMPFYDIKETAWYHGSLEFCYANDIIKGVSAYEAAPDEALTRESAVCVLARISGDDISGYTENHFNDTKENSWYIKEICWAYEKGYVKGIGNGKFGVGKSITREEFARIIFNYSQKNSLAFNTSVDLSVYTDSEKISDWALDAVEWCVESGLMTGTKENIFSPKMILSRSQIVKVAEKFIKNVMYAECEHILSEADCITPSVCESCGVVFELPRGHRCENLSCVRGDTCSVCSEYIKGDPYIHNFSAPTCTNKATCVDCGEYYGKTLPHEYSKATCTKKATCAFCGMTAGSLLPHAYSKASCTQAAKCSLCGVTSGSALGHTTYNGKCTRCNTVNYRKKIIRVDNIYQMKDYPNGCESVSTVMALRYLGFNISVDHFIDNYLPMGSRPVVGGIGPDPAEVFCGDPRSKNGWGCYSSVIMKALDSFLDENKYICYHSYSDSLKELCDKYIDNDIPVIVWGTINMMDSSASSHYAYWTTPNGKPIAYNTKLHCLLLVGYDENNYYFNDPTVNGNFCLAYSKSASSKAFSILGNQSIAIAKK